MCMHDIQLTAKTLKLYMSVLSPFSAAVVSSSTLINIPEAQTEVQA